MMLYTKIVLALRHTGLLLELGNKQLFEQGLRQ